jgi:hypothetical protein
MLLGLLIHCVVNVVGFINVVVCLVCFAALRLSYVVVVVVVRPVGDDAGQVSDHPGLAKAPWGPVPRPVVCCASRQN